ncbi:hypothetical protein LINGRAHAP2_LOCUS1538 [Linum grandiflorum]
MLAAADQIDPSENFLLSTMGFRCRLKLPYRAAAIFRNHAINMSKVSNCFYIMFHSKYGIPCRIQMQLMLGDGDHGYLQTKIER